jgi:hypothetical protein
LEVPEELTHQSILAVINDALSMLYDYPYSPHVYYAVISEGVIIHSTDTIKWYLSRDNSTCIYNKVLYVEGVKWK